MDRRVPPIAHRILLVRPSALGDVSRTVPALVSLRQAYPEARIDWLVNDSFVPAVSAHPALTGVVAYPRKRFSRIGRDAAVTREAQQWMSHLRAQQYDMVVDLQGLFRSGLITRLSGAGIRIGFANARELAWMGYNHRHQVEPGLHSVDRMLALLGAEDIPLSHDMRLYVPPADMAWLASFLDQHGLTGRPYAILAPTAKWLCKCWPIEHYLAIARRLLDTQVAGAKLIVLAAPSERTQVQELLNAFDDDTTLRVILPQTDVGRMMALLSQCRLLVCNDSAPLHIGVGFDRPIAAIFGPTDPALVGPYRRPETVLQPPGLTPEDQRHYRRKPEDQTLISRVTVATVWETIQSQLAARPADAGPMPGA